MSVIEIVAFWTAPNTTDEALQVSCRNYNLVPHAALEFEIVAFWTAPNTTDEALQVSCRNYNLVPHAALECLSPNYC